VEEPDERDCAERTVYYQDSDGDEFGSDDHILLACKGRAGWSKVGGDCDDTDPAVTTECHGTDTGDTEPIDTGEVPEDTGEDTGAESS
jgi:hypothetical protein